MVLGRFMRADRTLECLDEALDVFVIVRLEVDSDLVKRHGRNRTGRFADPAVRPKG
jgi:hypothetical protein